MFKSLSMPISALTRFALRTLRERRISSDDWQCVWRVFRYFRAGYKLQFLPQTCLRGFVIPTRQGLADVVNNLEDVFIWGVIDWHFRIQRPQHLARELAATGRRVFYFSVVFVEAAEPGFAVEKLDIEGRLFQVVLHLHKMSSIYSAPPGRDEILQMEEGLSLFLEWCACQSVINLVQHAFWLDVATKVINSRLIYDCMDHHDGFGGVSPEMIMQERRLAERAELVIVASQWLDQVMEGINPSRVIIRNACQYNHFYHVPEQIYKDGDCRKIIGYYGAIAEWFDVELVAVIAQRYAECLVLLVGADTAGVQSVLSHYQNVQFTGEVPYVTLPYYLYAFDVSILPFKVIPLTLATNPVKLYEYLSAGKTVVAVDLPEMHQFGNLVRVAVNQAEFVNEIGNALSQIPSADEVERRRNFAANQTWTHRAQQIVQTIREVPEPKVSVVVVTFNNLDFTKLCLRSLEKNSNYSQLEIIVVDNASSDGTQEILKKWVNDAPDRQLILNLNNKGFAAANNQGLALATGEYLVLLNNDTVVTPGWIRTFLNHLRRDASIGIIGPVTNNIGNEALIKIQYNSMEEMQIEAARYTRSHLGKILPIHTLAFFCVMFPRCVYEMVGPLDEAFGLGYFEDDDYCRRIQKLGLRVICAEDVFVHHHLSATFSKLGEVERRILFERNKALYEAKWGTWIPHDYRSAPRAQHVWASRLIILRKMLSKIVSRILSYK